MMKLFCVTIKTGPWDRSLRTTVGNTYFVVSESMDSACHMVDCFLSSNGISVPDYGKFVDTISQVGGSSDSIPPLLFDFPEEGSGRDEGGIPPGFVDSSLVTREDIKGVVDSIQKVMDLIYEYVSVNDEDEDDDEDEGCVPSSENVKKEGE